MKFWTKTVLLILPALVLLGCGTSGEVEEEGATGVSSTSTTRSEPSANTSGVSAASGAASGEKINEVVEEVIVENPLENPNSLLAKRVIYFDFDKSNIKSDFRAIIQAHAEYLASHSNVTVTLEGNTDERGTREYNMALGERRAKAVESMLTLQGVSPSQIRVISYGEEHPAALGHDEGAWALNRRVDIVYNR